MSKRLKNTAVVIGGAGHVGLPLALVLASLGIKTYSYDLDADKVKKINSGEMPFMEEGGSEVLKQALFSGMFQATTDPKVIKKAFYIFVVIGTPVDEHLGPNPNTVVESIRRLSSYFASEHLLILRSTIFPGVTRRIEELLSKDFADVSVCYCPERILEGKALSEIYSLPQIIGARNDEIFKLANEVFQRIGVRSIYVSPEEAELAKLYTNVWRYIKFGIANQFWMMANSAGVDYEKIRLAIIDGYPRAADLPRAGFAAGPCLFKDTMQLSFFAQQSFALGHSAMMINEGTPGYLVSQLKKKFDLRSMTVGILGVAFKGDSDDTRSSLAFKLRKILLFEAKEVLMADPLVLDDRLLPQSEVIKRSDLLIIGAPHSKYRNLDCTKEVVDIWGITGRGPLI
jgi:UDP-N-acetyl-D-mannosaminuronic acid dehydrogenase